MSILSWIKIPSHPTPTRPSRRSGISKQRRRSAQYIPNPQIRALAIKIRVVREQRSKGDTCRRRDREAEIAFGNLVHDGAVFTCDAEAEGLVLEEVGAEVVDYGVYERELESVCAVWSAGDFIVVVVG